MVRLDGILRPQNIARGIQAPILERFCKQNFVQRLIYKVWIG